MGCCLTPQTRAPPTTTPGAQTTRVTTANPSFAPLSLPPERYITAYREMELQIDALKHSMCASPAFTSFPLCGCCEKAPANACATACGHIYACVACAIQLSDERCPVCRSVTSFVPVYFCGERGGP